MEESRNTGQPHTQDSNENIYGASLWQRNCGGGMARVRPQPSSHVHEGLHQRLNHRILDPKRSVDPTHLIQRIWDLVNLDGSPEHKK